MYVRALRFIRIKARPIAKRRTQCTQTEYIRTKLRHHKNTEYYIRLLYLRAARLCIYVCWYLFCYFYRNGRNLVVEGSFPFGLNNNLLSMAFPAIILFDSPK